MKARLNIAAVSAGAYHAMLGLEKYIHESSIEPKLVHLLKMRASQINGCAYCLDMHSKDARALGETEQRLYGLDAWREAPYYTDRDEVYERARRQFSERELVELGMIAVAINGWNRLAIAFRSEAGTYQPRQQEPKRTP
jgi:AhpD family alkylhydroperoxidase